VLLPGYVINVLTNGAGRVLNHLHEGQKSYKNPHPRMKQSIRVPKALKLYGPTAIGLAAIPLIIAPIDEGVHWLMDQTWRR
jgi:hypothetical protein